MKSYTPPMKRPRKTLQSRAFSGVKCSRPTPGISAYSRAASAALQHGRRSGSSTAAARPGGKPCRTPGKDGFPPRSPRSVTFPIRDQGAAPQSGNSGNMRPSSISPAYNRGSPAAGSHSLYRSWRTTLSPAYGSPPFPAGSIHGSFLPPVFDRSCSR